jgi:hypothetical protein
MKFYEIRVRHGDFIMERVSQKAIFAAVSVSWDASRKTTNLTVTVAGDFAKGYITCHRTDEFQKYQSSLQCALAPRGKEKNCITFFHHQTI